MIVDCALKLCKIFIKGWKVIGILHPKYLIENYIKLAQVLLNICKKMALKIEVIFVSKIKDFWENNNLEMFLIDLFLCLMFNFYISAIFDQIKIWNNLGNEEVDLEWRIIEYILVNIWHKLTIKSIIA